LVFVADAALLVQTLDRKAAQVRAYCWAPSTWRTKASQWKKYIAFCALLLIPVVPTTVDTMCRFAVYLSDTLCYVSIDNYVSGVISLNRYFGYDVSHIRPDFVFSTTMKGLRRMLGDPAPTRITLTLENLLNMSLSIDWLSVNERSVWACIATSFRSLLRKCNLVPDNLKLEGHYMRRKSLRFMPWGVLLKISSSKTIQYGQRLHLIPLTYAPGSPLCATSLLKQHFIDMPAESPDTPVFLLSRGGSSVPLTYPVLITYLKRLLRTINMDVPGAGVHSLRRAGAAFLHHSGVPLEDIRQTGDWASLTALIYLAKPLSSRIDLDRLVVNTICQRL
jgi:hypothetical protein